MNLKKKQVYRILGVCCVLELAVIQSGCGNTPNTASQSAVPASARPTAISTPIASPPVQASHVPVSVMSAQPKVLPVPVVTSTVPSSLTSESAPVIPVVSATPIVPSSPVTGYSSIDSHTTGGSSGLGASRTAVVISTPTPMPTATPAVTVTPTPVPTPISTPFPTATPATQANPTGQAPLQFKTASFQYGPDSQFYPLTLADRGANTIHVCDCQPGADASCIAGQDANPGTANAPQQSILAAVTAFNQGQNIAFCRGGAWESASSLALDASHCRDESPCYIEDYGVSDQALPLITITSQDGQGAFDFDTRDNGTRWAGLRLYNLHLKKTTQDGLGSGIFLFRGISNVEMRGLEIEGFGIGVALNPNGLATSGIVLADSYLHDNGVMGWLGGTDQTLIERNRFHNNGHYQASMFNHNLYFSDKANQSVIRQNWISGSALDASGRCMGTSVVAHSGTTEDLRIEYNLIEENQPTGGCWGLAVDAAGSNSESHQNAIIRGNLLRDVGNIAIGVASCVDCLIEDNVVIQTQIGGSVGIAVPNRPTQAPDADNTRTTVRNNTVYFAGQGNGRHYYVGERGSNHVVTNNVGYSANPQPGDSCFDFDLPASAYRLVSHNLCFGLAFDSGTTGMDSMPLLADPLFRQAPEDLRLQAQSPARDSARAGEASAQDIDGNGRDASPDRGAFEF